MNNYEKSQNEAIKKWKSEEPSVVSQAVGIVFKLASWLIEKIIPSKAIEEVLSGCNMMAEWFCDIDDIKSDANVVFISELKTKDLELSDKLADEVHNWAVAAATGESGVAGFFELPGMIVDIPALITLGLRVIHKIGVCYGFESKSEDDKNFVLSILSTAGANTIKEKNTSVLLLRQISVKIAKDSWGKIVNQKVPLSVAIIAIKSLAKQLGINITKRMALPAIIPFIGTGVGAEINAPFINDIAWAARRAFQERWLIENQLIDIECEVIA